MERLPVAEWVSFGFAVTRCSGFLFTGPIWNDEHLPRQVKLGLCLAMSWLFFSAHSAIPYSGPDRLGRLLAVHLPLEFGIGCLLGLTFALIMVPLRIAGAFVMQELGLTLGSLANPTGVSAPPGLGAMFYAAGVLLLLGANLHHWLITAIAVSFRVLPAGSLPWHAWTEWHIREVMLAHDVGFVIVGGAVAMLTVLTWCVLFLAKTSPMFNLFTIGTSIRIGAGLLALVAFLPNIVWALLMSFQTGLDRMLYTMIQ